MHTEPRRPHSCLGPGVLVWHSGDKERSTELPKKRRKPLAAGRPAFPAGGFPARTDRKSTRLNSSHANISYAVFCLKKKKKYNLHDSLISSHEGCLFAVRLPPQSLL